MLIVESAFHLSVLVSENSKAHAIRDLLEYTYTTTRAVSTKKSIAEYIWTQRGLGLLQANKYEEKADGSNPDSKIKETRSQGYNALIKFTTMYSGLAMIT